MGYQVQIKFK